MDRKSLQEIYKNHINYSLVIEKLKGKDRNEIQLSGLKGSSDAVFSAAVVNQVKRPHLFVLENREQAAYFQNDLENVLGEKRAMFFFPISYKRPYEYLETENANILQRAEVLNHLSKKEKKIEIIITYPEALSEKVINKKSLVKNTLGIKIGDKLDIDFITEMLLEYGFEQKDFVDEPGSFSIRGGIVDIYSFSNDVPYRIELFGKEVESIRTFDPENQLSLESKENISIIPDVQTKLIEETRETFLKFLPQNTVVWIKDLESTFDVIEKSYERAFDSFTQIKESIGDTTVLNDPSQLFDELKSFKKAILEFDHIEFGSRFYNKSANRFDFKTKVQPSFNKKFDLLSDYLMEHQVGGFSNVIAADSQHQLNRLLEVLAEHDPLTEVQSLSLDLREGFQDDDEKILIFTDHQIFERYHKYKVKKAHKRSKILTLKELKSLSPGDFVTHIDYGIGRFAGMEKKEVDGIVKESVRIVYRDDDILYVSIHSLHKISKYIGKEGDSPKMSKLGSPEWETKKTKVKKRVKELAINLIQLYAERKGAKGFGFSPDNYMQAELETSFIYEDTPDQASATVDVKADMEKPYPMDRLVCGDVGFGKTEIAIRAAFKAALDGKQVAVMVPTTVLALQHYKTFRQRMADMPIEIEFINRFRTTKEIKEVLARLKAGKVDIIIGTHKLIGKSVEYKDLGLLIIDEEQKFGVAVKEKLKEFKVNVDVLTLTATPIPRTLQFSLMGARDLSIINTPPPNRQPVTTEIHSFNDTQIRDAVRFELKRGGQVFFVHNRVAEIESVANIILKVVPDARIGIAHGQMEGKQLEKVMLRFINHEYDILISTNIIESGLDIPNANTIMINQAHMFGMSDLHQMRGRVGRSNKKAFCYLMVPSITGITQDARKRLKILEEFSDLGDGFKISMRDLDIRGAGDMLGGEQSGFINDIGYDTYHKLLEEAVNELKQTEFRDLFSLGVDASVLQPVDCNIETDKEVIIPEEYVSNISERLRLYNALDNTKNQDDLSKISAEIHDRFGEFPPTVKELFRTVELRWAAEKLGFQKLKFKANWIKGYVPVKNNDIYFQSDTFGEVLAYVQGHSKNCSFKEVKENMVVTFMDINSIDSGIVRLGEVLTR